LLLPLSPESLRIAAFSLTASSYRSRIMSFLDKVKKASKGVIDAGAKTMLKVRFKQTCRCWKGFSGRVHGRRASDAC
jgi:hypothetical protein